MEIDEVIFTENLPKLDLHGYDRDSARIEINDFIEDNYRMGIELLLIVHGIGTGIIRQTTIDTLNKNKKVAYIDDSITENTTGVEDSYEVESSLEWVLKQIDKDLKEVVVLYYYDDLPINAIADMLQIPKGTVKSRLSRARKQIGKIINKKEGEFNGWRR